MSKLSDKLYKQIGFYKDEKESYKSYLDRLDKGGQLTMRGVKDILIIILEHLDKPKK